MIIVALLVLDCKKWDQSLSYMTCTCMYLMIICFDDTRLRILTTFVQLRKNIKFWYNFWVWKSIKSSHVHNQNWTLGLSLIILLGKTIQKVISNVFFWSWSLVCMIYFWMCSIFHNVVISIIWHTKKVTCQ